MNNISEPRYYFDTNALLKYYNHLLKHFQEEKGILRIRRLVANSPVPILVSPITSLELVGKATSFFRKNLLSKKTLRTLITHLRKDIGINTTTRPFEILELPDNVFRLAETILLEHVKFAIGSNDALHLAIVKKLPSSTIMVTSDKSLQHVCERTQVPFYDPEIE